MKLPHDHDNHAITESLLEEMPSLAAFSAASDVFKLLGDPSRVKLFWLLCHTEECVTDLAAMMDMSSPALSHHLKFLKTSGLIVSRRDGKEVFYKSADTELADALHHIIENVVVITCPHKSDSLKKI
ncbi:MAG: metalloregulator ArsR/SmtB family transcription factor [Lachnospiraceae bacterium]|nr:metalloregulator ArsR/SmtB family transcription factor [Lachnospiraceae bacterium]